MPNPNPHEVTLNYTADAQGHPKLQQPATIQVAQGDKIHFRRGSIPPEAKISISLTEPQFFSKGTFDEGDQPIEVTSALPHRTTYQCSLKDAQGNTIPGSKSGPANPGGDIDPDGGSPVG